MGGEKGLRIAFWGKLINNFDCKSLRGKIISLGVFQKSSVYFVDLQLISIAQMLIPSEFFFQ